MKQIVGTKKQLEQDIVRNFATVETANVQITLPEKETIFDEEKRKEQRRLRLSETWTIVNG